MESQRAISPNSRRKRSRSGRAVLPSKGRPHGRQGKHRRVLEHAAEGHREHGGRHEGKLHFFPRVFRGMHLPEKVMTRRSTANVGAVTLGAAGVVLANLVGVGELVVGMVVAYTAYRVIRYQVPPTEALRQGIQLERGETPEEIEEEVPRAA